MQEASGAVSLEASLFKNRFNLGNRTLSMIPTNSTVDHVLGYASKGWKPYPVQPPKGKACSCKKGINCPDPGKHPFHDLGGLSSATTDSQQLKTIFANSEASIGLRCDGFWVLDVDGEKGLADLSQLIAENGELPRTPTATTGGGGRHYLFKTDRRVAKNATKVQGLSIDIRTKGGAIVAPPSLHASGNRYEWLIAPDDCELAKAPEWLVEFVTQSKAKDVGEFVFEDLDLRTAPGATEGNRNSQLCRLVGSHLARLGDTPDLLQLATDWGRRCDPPMNDSAIAKTVANLVAKEIANKQQGEDLESDEDEESEGFDLEVTSFSTIEAKPVEWLWKGRFALGKITLLTGEGGVGKSMLTCDMASRISQGLLFPDEGVAPLGSVFFIGAEDGAEDTVRPRLDAAGANVDRIFLIQGPRRKGEAFASPIDLSLHMDKLDRLLSEHPDAKLLIIDPIMDYLGAATNSDKATDVRRVLSPLRSLAEKHQVSICAMNHLNKRQGGSSKNRSLGSGAFVQVARIELRVVEDPDDTDRRLLLPVKNNLAAAPGLAYRIESASNGSGYCVWEEGSVDISIHEVESEGGSEDRSAIDEAQAWLLSFLSEGPVKASEAKRKASSDGISEKTLKRAKKALEIIAEQKDRCWWWRLPEKWRSLEEGGNNNPQEAEEDDPSEESSFVF